MHKLATRLSRERPVIERRLDLNIYRIRRDQAFVARNEAGPDRRFCQHVEDAAPLVAADRPAPIPAFTNADTRDVDQATQREFHRAGNRAVIPDRNRRTVGEVCAVQVTIDST